MSARVDALDASVDRPLVRDATGADLPRLGRLGALLVEEHHAYDERRFLPTRERLPLDYAGFLLRQMRDANAVVLVAEDHGDVIGYAYATVEGHDYMALRGPAGVLQDVIVDPEARGRGVGCLLLEAAVVALAARGAPQVVLSTAARNERAQRLFARSGFRPTMIEMTRELGGDPSHEEGR
ncbi:MAG: GNAT family N-acetyltransferase [Gemmatimonadaceae bacterium]|nr:GNAT family N-acetyltransferase [Gemmatimonadaceae bacterium]